MKGSLITLAFFALGCAGGAMGFEAIQLVGRYSMPLLMVLMFLVGVSIGNDIESLKKLKGMPLHLLLLPVLTIVGSLLGGLLFGIFVHGHTLQGYVAVSAGLAYYSLSSIFITQYLGPVLGAIALISNIMREAIALTCAPIFKRFLGPLAPISAGGATSMDVTLPIITQTSGKEYAMLSVYHGFVCDLSVPFTVTFLCTL